jgi:hypothetical protein
MKYVVIRVGCLCCDEPTKVLGIYDNKVEAERIARKYEKGERRKPWTAEHRVGVWEAKDLGKS